MFLHHNGVPRMLILDPDSAGAVATSRIADALGLDDDKIHLAEHEKRHSDARLGPVAQARNQYSENLATKIARGFRVYLDNSHEYTDIANLTLVGGGVHLFGLGFYLKQALETVPLSRAQAASNIRTADGSPVLADENASGGDYLAAIGLAMGEVF